jgi:transposase
MIPGEHITDVAGVDISKRWLDVAFARSGAHVRFANTAEGITELIACLHAHGVRRAGMEASGDYEHRLRSMLEEAGFEVVAHQPQEVRAFARFRRIKAKSDRMDAGVIALATQAYEGIVARRDRELVDLAHLMTVYEQMCDLLAQTRTCAEHDRLEEVMAMRRDLIAILSQKKQQALRMIMARVRARPDLVERFDLLNSLPGIGQVVALALVIRMPELGQLDHGKASALLGVAPFDRDSGTHKGQRFITGGRQRPRDMVYIAALAAKRMNTPFRAFAERLVAAGKPIKVAIVAVMRKLIEAANLVLGRGTPWVPTPN